MTFSEKSRYDSLFRQVAHKGGESGMKYIKIFQNAQALSVSVGNSYTDYHLMHIFSDNFRQGEKYTHIEIRQAELRRERNLRAESLRD